MIIRSQPGFNSIHLTHKHVSPQNPRDFPDLPTTVNENRLFIFFFFYLRVICNDQLSRKCLLHCLYHAWCSWKIISMDHLYFLYYDSLYPVFYSHNILSLIIIISTSAGPRLVCFRKWSLIGWQGRPMVSGDAAAATIQSILPLCGKIAYISTRMLSRDCW